MTEIPRDGQNYLAWHKTEGFMIVYCMPNHIRYYDTSNHHISSIGLEEFDRWMDEKGHWHECGENPSTYIGKTFVFPPHNQIPWGMDFSCYSINCPCQIIFTLRNVIVDTKVCLVAPGYGGEPYGNGAIHVNLEDIKPYELKQ
jgi:hypothetical protein